MKSELSTWLSASPSAPSCTICSKANRFHGCDASCSSDTCSIDAPDSKNPACDHLGSTDSTPPALPPGFRRATSTRFNDKAQLARPAWTASSRLCMDAFSNRERNSAETISESHICADDGGRSAAQSGECPSFHASSLSKTPVRKGACRAPPPAGFRSSASHSPASWCCASPRLEGEVLCHQIAAKALRLSVLQGATTPRSVRVKHDSPEGRDRWLQPSSPQALAPCTACAPHEAAGEILLLARRPQLVEGRLQPLAVRVGRRDERHHRVVEPMGAKS